MWTVTVMVMVMARVAGGGGVGREGVALWQLERPIVPKKRNGFVLRRVQFAPAGVRIYF